MKKRGRRDNGQYARQASHQKQHPKASGLGIIGSCGHVARPTDFPKDPLSQYPQSENHGKKFQSPAEQMCYVNTILGLPVPTGEGIAAPILESTGRYEPKDLAGQAGMAGLRTAVGSLAPGAIFR